MPRMPICLSALALVFLVACGSPTSETAQTTELPPVGVVDTEGSGPTPDPGIWTNPLGQTGGTVPGIGAAALAFEPDIPELGDANRIVASDILGTPLIDRQIAWVYLKPAIGRFFVLEELVDGTQEDLEEPASHSPGCTLPSPADQEEHGLGSTEVTCYSDDFSIETIRGGTTRALVVQNEHVLSVTWLERVNGAADVVSREMQHPMLSVKVMGPAGELTLEEALSLANGV